MMKIYKRFKIGDRVIAITGNVLYSNQGNLKDNVSVGTEFEITAFPAQVTQDLNFTNYIKGVTNKGEIVTCYPNDIRKVTILYPVSCKSGAPMGRASYGEKPKNKKIFGYKVILDNEGYEKSGVYWGLPNNLRVQFTKDLSYVRFYRVGDKL